MEEPCRAPLEAEYSELSPKGIARQVTACAARFQGKAVEFALQGLVQPDGQGPFHT